MVAIDGKVCKTLYKGNLLLPEELWSSGSIRNKPLVFLYLFLLLPALDMDATIGIVGQRRNENFRFLVRRLKRRFQGARNIREVTQKMKWTPQCDSMK